LCMFGSCLCMFGFMFLVSMFSVVCTVVVVICLACFCSEDILVECEYICNVGI